MKKIILFGGSFNPPHAGHFEMAKYLHTTLEADEVWFLFSENWQKDISQYAPLSNRMEMARILLQHYPDMPFIMSNIQDELNTHVTYEVLTRLQEKFPDTCFIWTMGADNLASFHTWKNWEKIIQNFPIAVVDRPPYTDEALNSLTALQFQFLKAATPAELIKKGHGWYFLNNPKIDIASSNLLTQLRQGKSEFQGPFQDVAKYIREHNIYNILAR